MFWRAELFLVVGQLAFGTGDEGQEGSIYLGQSMFPHLNILFLPGRIPNRGNKRKKKKNKAGVQSGMMLHQCLWGQDVRDKALSPDLCKPAPRTRR